MFLPVLIVLGALQGTKRACLKIKDGGSNMAAKKVMPYYSSLIGRYNT